jgi:hypothetical protein
MRRLLVCVGLAPLLVASPAHADPFGELPFRPVQGVATCLRATGAPGELARWTPTGLELLQANSGGLAVTDTVRLGATHQCAQVAARPDGAAIAATVVGHSVRVAVRDPGGRFGAPVTFALAGLSRYGYVTVAVAVTPAGDALVGVQELELAKFRGRVLAFRRPAGGAFGRAEHVSPWRGDALPGPLVAGADAAGRLTLAWKREPRAAGATIEAADAPPGGGFGAVERIAAGTLIESGPALAVAPDGGALLAYDDGAGVTVSERAPGAARFGAPAPVAGGQSTSGEVSVALADGGAAVVAWRPDSGGHPGVRVSARAAAGAFGAPVDVVPARPPRQSTGNTGWTAVIFAFSGVATPVDSPSMRAAIAGGGYVVAWADDDAGTGAVHAASGPLGGGPPSRMALGPAVRLAQSVAPFALADGRAAVAWADDAFTYGEFPAGRGRLHLALAGAARAADAPPPAIAGAGTARRRLYPDQPITVPVRCSGPCDVRATVAGARASGGTLLRAGVLTLRVYPLGRPLSAPGAHTVTVTLRAATPGGRTTRESRVHVPVTMLRSPPVPQPEAVQVRRDGKDLVVSWRTAFAARRVTFSIVAFDAHKRPSATADRSGRGRRSFSVRLRGAAGARNVRIYAFGGSDQKPRVSTLVLTVSSSRA